MHWKDFWFPGVSHGIYAHPPGMGERQSLDMIYMDVNLFSNFQLRRWMSWKCDDSIPKLPNGHYRMTITIGVGADGKQNVNLLLPRPK